MNERSRGLLLLLLLGTIALGVGSREFAEELPRFVATYAGDSLWAVALFWLLALLVKQSTAVIAVSALVTSFAVEFGQLYQAPWINSLRSSQIGGLILGHGFLLSDLYCYTVGIAFAATVDAFWLRRTSGPSAEADVSR